MKSIRDFLVPPAFIVSALFIGLSTSPVLHGQEDNLPDGVTVKRIWGNELHNAFTSLIWSRGSFYCSFREGERHVYGADGRIRIISSADGLNWKSVALLEKKGFDLRDPKMSVMPDGRIMVIMGGSVYDGKTLVGMTPHVSFSDPSGKGFADPVPVEISQDIKSGFDWLWRITWHKKDGYGVVYQRKEQTMSVTLVQTRDGRNFELVAKLGLTGNPNEATVRVMPDGEMLMMVRREADDRMGMWGRSLPPYQEWKWTMLDFRLGGPDFIALDDNTLIAGSRVYHENGNYTALFRGNRHGDFREVLRLPSGGDSSYPGLIIHDKKLYISYYSSHEGNSSIYLVTVPIKFFREHAEPANNSSFR